jgi:DNA (cytosine-5)-methyltransferase 1
MQPITFGAQMSVPQTDVDMVQTLQAKNPMAVAQPVAFKVRGGVEVDSSGKAAGKGYLGSEETAFTLAATQDQWIGQPVGTDCYNGAITGEVAATIGTPGSSVNASGPTVMQAVDVKQVQWASGGGQVENDTAQALRAGAEYNYQFARVAMQVRRLTPTECERLQGFPDGYTNIPWRKKDEAPDGPRYKALGNSMAVPCMKWIGERIQAATARQEVQP